MTHLDKKKFYYIFLGKMYGYDFKKLKSMFLTVLKNDFKLVKWTNNFVIIKKTYCINIAYISPGW